MHSVMRYCYILSFKFCYYYLSISVPARTRTSRILHQPFFSRISLQLDKFQAFTKPNISADLLQKKCKTQGLICSCGLSASVASPRIQTTHDKKMTRVVSCLLILYFIDVEAGHARQLLVYRAFGWTGRGWAVCMYNEAVRYYCPV